MTTIKTYQNIRNANKFLEVHNDGHRHNSVRQYIRNEIHHNGIHSIVINYTGDGNLHRWRKGNLTELLTDYQEV